MKLFIDKLKNHIYWLKISSGLYDGMDDETFLKMAYKRKFGKELDLNNPVTFNEKLQWLKLNDRKPEYTEMVDKFMAKKYVASIIGQEHIIPTLGVWSHFDDIDFDELPTQFVLKCTHDSGGLVVCKDKNNLNKKAAKKENALKKAKGKKIKDSIAKVKKAKELKIKKEKDSVTKAKKERELKIKKMDSIAKAKKANNLKLKK